MSGFTYQLTVFLPCLALNARRQVLRVQAGWPEHRYSPEALASTSCPPWVLSTGRKIFDTVETAAFMRSFILKATLRKYFKIGSYGVSWSVVLSAADRSGIEFGAHLVEGLCKEPLTWLTRGD